MENVTVFKKFEVIGTTKDEAKAAAAPMNLMVDATSTYKKWAKENVTSEAAIKNWMKEYLKAKKYDKPGLGAYIVLQKAVVDSRERPYKEVKPKYEARTHTFERVYVGRAKDTGSEVFAVKNAKEAIAAAKEFVIDEHVGVDIFVEAKVKEKNSLYTTIEYTPSKGAQPCKLLVFGYENVD